MPEKLEKLIRFVYKKWKLEQPQLQEPHPDEETIVCFLENKLSGQESEHIKTHLTTCDSCAEVVAVQLKLKAIETKEIPEAVLMRVKNLVVTEDKASILGIFLKLKEKALEILNTTGDVLVGQELVPASILRSRKIKDFQDEVTILKDFKDIRVEVKSSEPRISTKIRPTLNTLPERNLATPASSVPPLNTAVATLAPKAI